MAGYPGRGRHSGRLSRSRVAENSGYPGRGWQKIQAIQVAGGRKFRLSRSREHRQAIQVAGGRKFRLSRSRVAENSGYPGRGWQKIQAIQVAGGRLSRSRVAENSGYPGRGWQKIQAIQVAGGRKFRLSRSRVAENSGYPGRGSQKQSRQQVENPAEWAYFSAILHTTQAIQVAGRFLKPLNKSKEKRLFLSLSFYPLIYPLIILFFFFKACVRFRDYADANFK